MPMWATAKMPYVPSPYMPMGMMTMTGPYDPSCMTYTNSTLSSTMLGGGGGAAYTRRMSMDEYNRAVPHADVLRQSSSGRRPSQDYDRRPNASSAKTIKAPALALPLKDKVRSRSHHHRRPLHDDDEDEVDAYERRKGRGSSSARTWPDSDTDSDGSEAWAAMPGKPPSLPIATLLYTFSSFLILSPFLFLTKARWENGFAMLQVHWKDVISRSY